MDFFGKTFEELKDWAPLIHPDDRERVLALWRCSLETGQPVDVEQRVLRADGVYRWVHSRGLALRDTEGHIVRWYYLITEIDDSKKMAEALQSAQARLSRATQIATVAELSASIAHEINQPLAAVVANGEACESWLSTDPPNLERARLAVQRIIRDGNSAAEVVQQTRALFKQEAPSKVPLDMNEVIGEVLRLVSNEVLRKGIGIETDLEDNLPGTSADRVQMQQLLVNLVHNAIEAMEGTTGRPKLLFLRSRQNGAATMLIEIRDYGCGLEDPERIFEPFFTTKEKGMGMGLSICHSIIEAHEGQLWANSIRDEGTTFSFTLPIIR
jgi:PAS domain S-box-containing protein